MGSSSSALIAGPPLYGAQPCALSGRVVGRYEILGELAHGGMAEVYLARQTGIDRFEKLVALKCIARRFADDEYFVAMFVDEARTAADLRHPNIVQTYEVGAEGGVTFMAMEFLHGKSLSALLRARAAVHEPLPADVAVHIAREAALGLHAAHTKRDLRGTALGIVHRDVSPQNLFVTVDGVVKVVDFGIAKARDRSVETEVGSIKGKAPYMSPEQAEGQELDGRSDQFSLGVVLWEMLVGRQLFRRDNNARTLEAVRVCDVPAPSTQRAGVPRLLDDVVVRVLARDREQRYRDCAALSDALERAESELGYVPRASRLASFLVSALEDAVTAAATDPAPPASAAAPAASAASAAASADASADARAGAAPADASSASVSLIAALSSSSPSLSSNSALADAPTAPSSQGASSVPTAPATPSARAVATQDESRLSPKTQAASVRRVPRAALALSALAIAAVVAAVVVASAGEERVGVAVDAGGGVVEERAAPPPATPTATTATAPPESVPVVSEPAPEPVREGVKRKAPKPTTTNASATTTAAAPVGEGTIWFRDVDPYFNVRVDGVAVGSSPRRHMVSAGTHRVELRAPDTETVVKAVSVDVADGAVVEVRAR